MTDITQTTDGIEITLTARFGDTIEGWPEAREDLGLNKAGDPVAGVELVDEEPHYWGDDEKRNVAGYGPVTLRFPTVEAVGDARDHLYDMAEERYRWGADGDAIHSFCDVLPSQYDVDRALESGAKGADG